MKVSTARILLASLCGSALAAPITADINADVTVHGDVDARDLVGNPIQGVTDTAGLGNLAGGNGLGDLTKTDGLGSVVGADGLGKQLGGVTGATGGVLNRDNLASVVVDAKVNGREATVDVQGDINVDADADATIHATRGELVDADVDADVVVGHQRRAVLPETGAVQDTVTNAVAPVQSATTGTGAAVPSTLSTDDVKQRIAELQAQIDDLTGSAASTGDVVGQVTGKVQPTVQKATGGDATSLVGGAAKDLPLNL